MIFLFKPVWHSEILSLISHVLAARYCSQQHSEVQINWFRPILNAQKNRHISSYNQNVSVHAAFKSPNY